MQIGLYILMFIIGSLFGSFFTLAIHRLPLNQNIAYGRSYCPKCKHKLEFLDLFPVFSYIFLKGKCRYCKEKVNPKYLITEVLSGITFVLFTISLNFNINNIMDISKIVYFIIGLLFISILIIISGINRKNNTINKSVLVFGIVVVAIYILYLCMIEKENVYRYAIYLSVMLILLIVDTVILKKKGESKYVIDIFLLCIYLSLFRNEIIFILAAIFTLLFVSSKIIFYKILNIGYKAKKTEAQYSDNFYIGAYLCNAYIITLILVNFMQHFSYYK